MFNSLVRFDRGEFNVIDNQSNDPIYQTEDCAIVFNGILYNHFQLSKMAGKNALTDKENASTDKNEGEIILSLYRHFGSDFITMLEGAFAFVLYDINAKKIIAASDKYGIKPCYYIEDGEQIYFSFDLKNFIYGKEYEEYLLCHEALHHYLTFQYVPQPLTILNNIKCLKPGTFLSKLLDNPVTIHTYWEIRPSRVRSKCTDKKEIIEDIKRALKSSVEKSMNSCKTVGSFLSSGIDSSIISLLARNIDPNIKTFTIGFDMDGYSEIDEAKKVADFLGVENISKIITPEEVINELPNIIWSMDSPIADPAAIPQYFISMEASKHADIMLSGEGADELFGGYGIYREPDSLRVFSYIPKHMKSMLKHISQFIPDGARGKNFIERGCTPIEERYVGNAKIFKEKEKKELLKNYNSHFSPSIVTKPLFSNAKGLDGISKMQYIDLNTWLIGDILPVCSSMCTAHSIEIRCPYLNEDVLQIAANLSKEDKLYDNITKYILRQAFEDELPPYIIKRKKLGYPVPIRQWLKDELYEWAIYTINTSFIDEYIRKDKVISMINDHKKGNADYSRKIWAILVLAIWHRFFMENMNKKVGYRHFENINL